MDAFKEAMNRIKADDILKENTKAYVMQELAQQNAYHERNNFSMKKTIIALSAAAACALLAFGGYSYYSTPVSYISLDINPSVELGVNAFGVVVRTEGTNEDGQLLLKNHAFTNKSVKNIVQELVQEAAAQGFIATDGSSVIAVTSETDDDEDANDLQNEGVKGANAALEEKKINAVVYTNAASLELRTEAKAAGISPGKYKMIKLLQILDPTIKVEDYQDAKMSAIIEKANELLSSSDNVDEQIAEIEQAFAKIKTAAGDVTSNQQSAANSQAQNKNKNQTSSSQSEQEQEQEQNQSTTSNMEQNQNKNQNGNANGNSGKTKTSETSSVTSTTSSATSSNAVSASTGSSTASSTVSSSAAMGSKGNGNGNG